MAGASDSGHDHRIAGHGYEAAIASHGASLRALAFDGRDLVIPFDADEERPAMRGALLAPWPNRLADGCYRFDGGVHHLPINEHDRGNATHGLVTDVDFALIERTSSSATLATTIAARPGYPWSVTLSVTIAIDEGGLTHTVTATNESDRPAPFGLGVHPYLLAGAARPEAIDSWQLEVPAAQVLIPTRDRLLPGALVPVEGQGGGELDLRGSRPLGARRLNHSFTGLSRGGDGLARIRVTDGHGTGVEAALDPPYRWVHVYTSDEVDDGRPRTGIAVEPATCPPDAFNSGQDLIVLEPGGSTTASFRLRALRGTATGGDPLPR